MLKLITQSCFMYRCKIHTLLSIGVVLWQSFDHPTDTLLPVMKVGLNKKTGHNGLLTSWKDEDDPRGGDFSFGVDPQRQREVFIWRDSHPYIRYDIMIESWTNNDILSFSVDRSDEGIYVSFSVFDKSIATRWTLSRTGALELLFWTAINMK
ncbi:hypothetical protein Sjap_005183 [Stephania japonica]|uniref:Bulb-type lectin domain-containing protein n=1 Tax=Stephania japonica TaxID=461633 RepID=A0AAP0K4L9_9MAGN